MDAAYGFHFHLIFSFILQNSQCFLSNAIWHLYKQLTRLKKNSQVACRSGSFEVSPVHCRKQVSKCELHCNIRRGATHSNSVTRLTGWQVRNGLYFATLGCTGLHRAVMECTGLHWALLGYTGLKWVVLDSSWLHCCCGLYWGVLGYTELYWAVLGNTWQYWAVLGCTRLYWALYGCTWLYWLYLTVLGCTWLYWAVLGCPGGPWSRW